MQFAASSTSSNSSRQTGRQFAKPELSTFIVEDSNLILENLIDALGELGPTPVQVVGHAADEHTALQGLAKVGGKVDLLITDIFLRQGSGLAVLQAATKAGLPAHRVVLTNYATAAMRQRCVDLGAHRVFDKSTDLDELLGYCAELAEGNGRTATSQ